MPKSILRLLLTVSAVLFFVSCSPSGKEGSISVPLVDALSSGLSSYPSSAGTNFRISLTDAPAKDLTKVFVNVAYAELFIRKGGKEARVKVANNLGMVDLMTLRNGILLPIQDLNIPAGTEVTQIRLILNGANNHAIKTNGSRCDMQTPSGQQSGIKIHLVAPFVIDNNYVYSMVMDFDALKSVIIKGNGGCLLKPVLKLMQVTRTVIDSPAGDDEPVTDGNDSNGNGGDTGDGSGGGGNPTDDGAGFDPNYVPGDDPNQPPIINPDDLAGF